MDTDWIKLRLWIFPRKGESPKKAVVLLMQTVMVFGALQFWSGENTTGSKEQIRPSVLAAFYCQVCARHGVIFFPQRQWKEAGFSQASWPAKSRCVSDTVSAFFFLLYTSQLTILLFEPMFIRSQINQQKLFFFQNWISIICLLLADAGSPGRSHQSLERIKLCSFHSRLTVSAEMQQYMNRAIRKKPSLISTLSSEREIPDPFL